MYGLCLVVVLGVVFDWRPPWASKEQREEKVAEDWESPDLGCRYIGESTNPAEDIGQYICVEEPSALTYTIWSSEAFFKSNDYLLVWPVAIIFGLPIRMFVWRKFPRWPRNPIRIFWRKFRRWLRNNQSRDRTSS